jgi:hypothetical protein
MLPIKKTILAIGGTGAQGVPVVKGMYFPSLYMVINAL